MRMLATMTDESSARRLGDYLVTRKIDAQVEPAGGGWAIWVVDDDDMESARNELRAFEANPNHARYDDAQRDADRVRARRDQQQQRLARNYVDVRTHWARPSRGRVPVTATLIGASVLVALATGAMMGDGPGLPRVADWLRFSTSPGQMGFEAILTGQVWRLVTPIFIHFGIIHLFFNMLWMASLGALIERQRGSWRLAVLVLVAAVVSNGLEHLFDMGLDVSGVVQFAPGSSFFGGMSGVVYALFGYVWMRSRHAPEQGMGIHQQAVLILMVWLVICMVGWMPIANMAHFAGLVVGLIAGWAPVKWKAMRRRSR